MSDIANMFKGTQGRISLFVSLSLLASCDTDSIKKAQRSEETNAFKERLVRKQIGTTKYYISVPATYSIKEVAGPDFSMYYYFPTDTTVEAGFTGGMYFGNFPSMFSQRDTNCQTETAKSTILGDTASWVVYNCNGAYDAQVIIASNSDEEWNTKIHAFGHATSRVEMTNVFDIFSTLVRK
jgi:hypothetical protein